MINRELRDRRQTAVLGDLEFAIPTHHRTAPMIAALSEHLLARRLHTAAGNLPETARHHYNHALRLAEAGRRAEALTASQEAVDLYGELAAGNRDAYLPNLAMSVNNHALSLAATGRRAEALTASQEAVDLRRELAAGNRDAYLPDLARGLWGYAWVRQLLGTELAEGLAAAVEAVDLYTSLARSEPAAFGDDLASTLGTRADILEALGRSDEAEEIREQASSQRGRSGDTT